MNIGWYHQQEKPSGSDWTASADILTQSQQVQSQKGFAIF